MVSWLRTKNVEKTRSETLGTKVGQENKIGSQHGTRLFKNISEHSSTGLVLVLGSFIKRRYINEVVRVILV